MIFNIQRFSTHDGRGVRTIIFYKGCLLRCAWCSNPESQSFGYSIMYDKKTCKNFGDCLKGNNKAITSGSDGGILINRQQIDKPEQLRDVCASKALTVSGEKKSVDELLVEIEKDRLFYRNNGGVTFSGGEPLAQGEELISLLRELKNRDIDVAIETTLYVAWDKVERCLGLVGTFLVDLKHTDKTKFNTYTGGDLDVVLTNLKKLANQNENIIIRVPVIPEFNHSEHEMKEIIDFAATCKNVAEIHFLPYHTLGVEKYKMVGMEYKFGIKKQVSDSELTGYIEYAKLVGLQTKIGG